MRFLLNGSSSSAYLYRSQPATVYAFNNDGSPLALTGSVVVDLYTTADGVSPAYSLTVTPDGSLGTYGVGTLELPGAAGLTSGSTYYARLRTEDGSGTAGKVVGATLSLAGAGYKLKPTVTVDGQGVGSGATLAITLTPSGVASTEITNAGSGYSSTTPPSIAVSGGNPTVPAVVVPVIRGPITTVALTNAGAYVGIPSVTASDGSGAVLTPVMMTPIGGISISAGGTGYQNGTWDITSHGVIGGTVTVSGGVVTAVNFVYCLPSSSSLDGVALSWTNKTVSGSGAAFTYTRLAAGSLGYTTPSATTASDTCTNIFGSDVVLDRPLSTAIGVSDNLVSRLLFYKSGGVLAIAVTWQPGTSFAAVTNQDIVFTGGPFTGAGVTVRFNGGSVSTPPTPSIQAGGTNFTYPVILATSGASSYSLRKTGVVFDIDGYTQSQTSTSYVQGGVDNSRYEWIAQGSGLSSVPSTWIWLATGQTANSVTTGMTVRYAAVDTVTVTSGGAGYKSDSPLSFSGGSPSVSAAGAVTAINGSVQSLTLTPGSGYQDAPTLTFSSGTATAVANLSTSVASVAVTAQGAGYTKQAQAVLSGGTPTTPAKITLVMGSGATLLSYNRIAVEVE